MQLALIFMLISSVQPAQAARASKVAQPAPQPSVAPPLLDFQDELEKDFTLREGRNLQVTNLRGDISIQGWSLDRIRVKARRKAKAPSEEEAKKLFTNVDFRFKTADGVIELSAEYGKGMSLQEKIREREDPRTEMEMTVYAPANLKLKVWSVNGQIKVKGWNAPIDMRASSGEIMLENVKSGGATVLCPACEIRFQSVNGPIRCMGGSGPVEILRANSPQVYVETSEGSIRARQVHGEQLYVSKEGAIQGRELSGQIEFHTQSAGVEILESSGFLSGRTTSGNITARMRNWKFLDKAVIESVRGDIRIGLPTDFSGDVDVFSGAKRLEIGFPVETKQGAGERSGGRVTGRVGEGGELLKVHSAEGRVQVVRGG